MDKDDQDQDNFKSYLNRNGYSIIIIYAGLRLHPYRIWLEQGEGADGGWVST